MKKNYTILLFGILLMLAGCKKDNPDGIPEGALLLTTEGFVGPGGAKTSVNGTSVQWDNGDQVLIRDTVRTVTVNTERTRAYIEGFKKSTSGVYYGYSPHDLSVTTADATTVTVPSIYECHYTGGRQVIKLPLIGKAHCADDVIRFRHVTAAVKLDIKNATGVPVVLDSVVVSSATQQLSGSCGVTISVGGLTVNAPQTTSTPANRKVKVTFTDSPVIETNGTNAIKEVQIPILPISKRTDNDFTITIYTHANITGAAPGARYIFSHAGTNDALARNEMMTAKIALSDGGGTHPTGLIPVNPQGKKVIFSQANLKYQASTGIWRFHDYQWDYIGSASGNTTAEANRSTQSDWVDLFGWGTGTSTKAISVSVSPDYYTTYDEWGDNPIENGGNQPNLWRTLTSEEWNYVLNERGAQNTPRYAQVKIAGSHQGLIIFPDNYSLSLANITTDGHDLIVNTPSTVYNGNELSLDTWRQMEAAGAVFLPAAGYRVDNTVNPYNPTGVLGAGQEGVYWSASASNADDNNAYRLLFNNSNTGDYAANHTTPRYFGYAVRLVMDVPIPSNTK